MLHQISLRAIRSTKPCADGWDQLLRFLGYGNGKYNPDRLVTLGDVAASNGSADALWVADHLLNGPGSCSQPSAHCNVVWALLPSVKRAAMHAADGRVHDCIAAIEMWIDGKSVDLVAAATAAEEMARTANTVTDRAAARAAASMAIWIETRRLSGNVLYKGLLRDAASLAELAAEALDVDDVNGIAWGSERRRQVDDFIAVFGLSGVGACRNSERRA